MQPIIKVNNLSKQYRLGTIGTGSISHDVNRWWHRVRGKEDPYLTIGETNDRSTKGESEYVWALRDVNFTVMPGDILGIIGRNGAGKSTLLKILSRITTPTTGSVQLRGRVASLLEVGTGMHPELTGRENIYLNGAILGMRKKEIDRKLDEIIDFSGVERYIDTPVKRYSSGMHVRLGFAVAAHLEPEILIIDEVLAVGDAEFQRKCIGKMQDVSKKEGRTVMFVSHNMVAIQKLCTSCLLLQHGSVVTQSSTKDVINDYLKSKEKFARYIFNRPSNSQAYIKEAWCENSKGMAVNELPIGEKWKIKYILVVLQPVKELICGVGVTDFNEVPINTSWHQPFVAQPGVLEITFEQVDLIFASGKYLIQLGIMDGKQSLEFVPDAFGIEIVNVIEQMEETVVKTSSETGMILNQMKASFRILDKNFEEKQKA
jgi:ABC-type polysaccharide/polyol phosphate transport system ATPase subunit